LDIQAFTPTGNNLVLAGDVVGVTGSLPITAGTPPSDQCRVYNSSAAIAFIRFGKGAQVPAITDAFVAPGATEVFTIDPTVTDAGAILSAGTGNVYFQRGLGL
jgi:hypothetical protein